MFGLKRSEFAYGHVWPSTKNKETDAETKGKKSESGRQAAGKMPERKEKRHWHSSRKTDRNRT